MNEESKKLFLETDFDSVLFNPLDFKTKLIQTGWYFITKQINDEPVRIILYESEEDYRDDEILSIDYGSTFEEALITGLKKCKEYYQR
jgi:hypothetical protein